MQFKDLKIGDNFFSSLLISPTESCPHVFIKCEEVVLVQIVYGCPNTWSRYTRNAIRLPDVIFCDIPDDCEVTAVTF